MVSTDMKPLIRQLSRHGKVYNYFFTFTYYRNRFDLNDLIRLNT